MRSTMIRAGVAAVAAAVALAACASHGIVPSSAGMPDQSASAMSAMQPLALYTCAKSPPQYFWIFKGACDKLTLKPTGATFSLGEYDSITIKGSIGKNTTKGTATVYLADATDAGGDITTYKGTAFPKYKAKGTTFVYAVAINQSTQTIKPLTEKGKPILQYVITDAKKLPGSTCGVALLTSSRGKYVWTGFPGTFKAKGNTVTITQYAVPAGFQIGPKSPLYFGVNCY